MLEYFANDKKKLWKYFYFLYEAPYIAKYGKGIDVLTPKQMLQRLLIALAKVKAGNTL